MVWHTTTAVGLDSLREKLKELTDAAHTIVTVTSASGKFVIISTTSA